MLLDAAYVLVALVLGAPYLLLRLLRRKPLAPPAARLGFIEPPPSGPGPLVWVHAVSVGEALAVRDLVEGLRGSARPLVTCTTPTGLAVARDTYAGVEVRPSPFDLGCAVRRFLARTRPDLVVLVELELWPNQLRILARRAVPVVVVNGKLSERSARGYRWLLRVLPRFLDGVRLFLMQGEEAARRLEGLGVPRERIAVTGNLKFDNVRFRDPGTERGRLRAEHGFPAGARILVAGSTHPGEEALLLAALRHLRAELPEARLVVAPRHPGRAREVLDLVRREGLVPGRRSVPAATPDPDVLVVDTMGELPILYGLGDAAFVGGTLVPVGGHNLLEPSEVGLPVVVGPHLSTVREVAEALVSGGALEIVEDAGELTARVQELLRDAGRARTAARRARNVIEAHQGSVGRTLRALRPLLEASAARSSNDD